MLCVTEYELSAAMRVHGVGRVGVIFIALLN